MGQPVGEGRCEVVLVALKDTLIVKLLGLVLLFDGRILLCSMTISGSLGLRCISNGIPGGKGARFSIPFDDELGCGGLDGELSSCPGNGVTFFQN